jgi:hypothetical protein
VTGRPLDEFRKELGERAEPLNVIWRHLLDRGEWIARADLDEACRRRGIPDGRSRLAHLGGSIVRDAREGGRACYRLTLLGVLLTDDGASVERLLARYLEWLRARGDAGIGAVSSHDVAAGLALDAAETAVLGRALSVAPRWGCVTHGGAAWRIALPAGGPAEPDPARVGASALASYDPEIPIDDMPRE